MSRARLKALGAACLASLLCISGLAASQAQDKAKLWRAGNYSFSDELGGFAIHGVYGLGTREDPIVIREELYSASPVTLTVREATPTIGSQSLDGNLGTGALFLRLQITNSGGQSWVEFELELQEVLNHSSTFADGLSFDQRRESASAIGASAFAHYSRDFEPYDRLRFSEGKMDTGETATFEFPLTDFTPRWQFYIVQDPRIPYS